jgi:hypothetical protein
MKSGITRDVVQLMLRPSSRGRLQRTFGKTAPACTRLEEPAPWRRGRGGGYPISGSGIRLAHDGDMAEPIRDSVEPSGPIDFVLRIGNVNARPSIPDEIGGLEDGSGGGDPFEFRMAAAWIFSVDRE